ncbi:KN motif and ankyrin repeat domain-containing protein 2 isoform X2 [Folsomia candida]|uniref:KN motif and ankyrin repeat domain-containing protein 2 isoform X2 n=1 Tax=Folsomia candida TaxID=158441 RepID=UPI001604DED7|nr:KN motif and ankyrin repeat domain-containing protein 2 isoform X2 [Folsomia candida]
MPSVGLLGRNLVRQVGTMNEYGGSNEERCDCCPYGYHIDLDFVPFSKKMLSREGDYERLKQLKDKWRSERKSMDTLLGVDYISTPSSKICLSPNNLSATLSRATKDVWRERSSWKSKNVRSLGSDDTDLARNGSSSSSELLLENGLSEAVTDFEEALQRTRPQSKILSYEIPDSQKFHTFPRIKTPALRDPVTGTTSNLTAVSNIFSNRATSGSTSTNSASTVVMRDSLVRHSSMEMVKRSQDLGELEPQLFSRVGRAGDGDEHETKFVELERQVKLIPELETKLKDLAAEKRQLLQLLEIERSKCASMTKDLLNNTTNKAPTTVKRLSTRDAGVQKSVATRDVGVTHIMPRMRTIAVGGNVDISTWERSSRGESCSPTGSSNGTLRRRVKTFDAGVQVKDYDFPSSDPVPVLQIVEGVEFGVQVDTNLDEPMKAPPRKKHAGTMAKPVTSDVGMFHKPTQRDAGSAMDTEPAKPIKPRVKHVGISATLDEDKPKVPDKVKPNRAIATNTDRLRVTSIGCNTTAEGKPRATSSSSQTDNVEPSTTTPTIAGVLKKRTMTLPFSTASSSPSVLQKSPGDTKGLSKIPRLTSPLSSPGVQQRVNAVSSPNPDRSESPASSASSGTHSPSPAAAESLVNYSPIHRKPAYQRSDTYIKELYLPERSHFGPLEPLEEEDREGPRSSSASSSSGFVPLQERREKISPSKEMQAALKVLNDALLRGKTTEQVTNAISIILHEWFRVAGTKTANPFDVEDYLDSFEIYSPQLLRYIVNMPDGNGNTALHYAVSHGNFDVVSILLDSKVCDPNKANKAGYTSIMLVALANISCEAHRQVVRRLFSLGDVNIKAAQHGQTALMLGASHGRFDTIRLLLEAGADINIQDEDGSTALMCAAEHGHMKIVKYLLAHPDCNPHITDNDGSTAFR